MTTKLEGILAGPEVDEYHKVSNDFTTPQKEAEYVKELTKLLTEIVGDPLEDYLNKEEVKGDIKKELAGINEGDEVVVAELVADKTNFKPSALSSIFSSHTDFQEMFMGDTVVQESTTEGTELVSAPTSVIQPATPQKQSGNASEQDTERVVGILTSAQKQNTGNPPTLAAGGNSTGFEASGGFRKTNKRRNKKGRKRSKGTRKK